MDGKSKKISKNTIMLTIRMILLMVISLYTSRIILIQLGVEDFGIYNALSCLAVTFSFFSSALINASQRFLTIEIGKNNIEGTSNVFKLHLTCYIIIGIIIFTFTEIAGNYIINDILTIPIGRLNAAYWTFQFAVFTVIINLMTIPFEAIMVAYEDMDVYAYIGVGETILKLISVFFLSLISLDKLILFAFIMFFWGVSSRLFFILFSLKKYKECKIGLLWDWGRIKDTMGFVVWNFISTAQAALSDQGLNLLLNIFIGPIANAAKGIYGQVSGAVFKLTNNILIATQPQMVKSYTTNDTIYLTKLFFYSSRFSFFALWFLIAPIIFCTDGILNLWLKETPHWTSSFIKIGLVGSLFYVLSKPIWSIIIAIGKLKLYVLGNFCVTLIMFIFSFIALKRWSDPNLVFIINSGSFLTMTIFQLVALHRYFTYSYKEYVKSVIVPIMKVVVSTTPLNFFIVSLIGQSGIKTIVSCLLICSIEILLIFSIGLQKEEKNIFLKKLRRLNDS